MRELAAVAMVTHVLDVEVATGKFTWNIERGEGRRHRVNLTEVKLFQPNS